MIHIIFKPFTVFAFLNIIRFRDVMVSIPDFESGNPGSNPGETYNLTITQYTRAVDCKSICRVFEYINL